MINVFALAALTEEITDAWRRQLQTAGPGADRTSAIIRDFAYSALWMTYGAGLMLIGFWKKSPFLRWQALILMGATICKVFLYDTSSLDRGYRILSFIALGRSYSQLLSSISDHPEAADQRRGYHEVAGVPEGK